MAETVENHDFIEIDYTGKLASGEVFDTTQESVAKENNLITKQSNFSSMIICVGEKQILPGLDDQLDGKEIGKEYTFELKPEDAFGKRDVKKMKIIPSNTFKDHKVQPHPGLQVDVDGERGTITRVSGGRIIVNFNHPLAGKNVIYTIKVLRKVTDTIEKVKSFLHSVLRFPIDAMKVSLKDKRATVEMPMALPPQFTDAVGKKLAELVKLDEIAFTHKEVAKK